MLKWLLEALYINTKLNDEDVIELINENLTNTS
jgi:hypothetical protein